jgi:hypothetical protein
MKKYGVILLGVALLSACTNIMGLRDEPPPSSQSNVLSLSDADFDHKLSRAMRTQEKKIKVLLPTGIDPEEERMPKPLEQWMATIQESGGKMNYEPDEKLMDGGLLILGGVFLITAIINEFQNQYDAAKNYNARLCYQRDDNMVSKIVFVDRDQIDDKTPVCAY